MKHSEPNRSDADSWWSLICGALSIALLVTLLWALDKALLVQQLQEEQTQHVLQIQQLESQLAQQQRAIEANARSNIKAPHAAADAPSAPTLVEAQP
ncbi:MAG: hypothetical protein R3Y10_12040 [Ferrimonas sp.]